MATQSSLLSRSVKTCAPEDVDMSVEQQFDPSPDNVREARRFVALHVPDERVSDAEIVVSELVTNAIEHAATPVTVRVTHNAAAVRVEVCDSSGILPAVRDLLGDSDRGRGLHLVERLSDAWGVESSDSGKIVWFEVAAPESL